MEQGVREQAAVNQEQSDAWGGVLFERFVQYRELVVTALVPHGEHAMNLYAPRPGDRALDLGCGFGDASQAIANLVGPEGSVLGVDISEPFIQASREEAEAAGVENVEFRVADVQADDLAGPYDYVFSRMGVMFFDNPVAALRNVRASMNPGARFAASVWRRKIDNDWLHRAELVVEQYLEEPEDHDEPTCGPGPFSMANADTVTEQFAIAGFDQISLYRCDLPLKTGNDLDHAVEFAMALGPAGEVIRTVGEEEVARVRPQIEKDLREALADFVQDDGTVVAPASSWVIGAKNPG